MIQARRRKVKINCQMIIAKLKNKKIMMTVIKLFRRKP